MDPEDSHRSSTLSPVSAILPAHVAYEDDELDDLSDSGLSQFEAEIEQNLSSTSPGGTSGDAAHLHVSNDPIDVDTEELKPANANKARKRTHAREYYDPELFGLRRSVSRLCPLKAC